VEVKMSDSETGVLELEVVALRRESDCVLSIELADPERRLLPAWEPRAHVYLGMPDHVRQYSLVGNPAQRHCYRIAVLREPASSGGSAYVHEVLRPGEFVEVGGPRNNFPLVEADRYLFIAGGIGITPLLPMIDRLQAEGRDWRLLYGGGSPPAEGVPSPTPPLPGKGGPPPFHRVPVGKGNRRTPRTPPPPR